MGWRRKSVEGLGSSIRKWVGNIPFVRGVVVGSEKRTIRRAKLAITPLFGCQLEMSIAQERKSDVHNPMKKSSTECNLLQHRNIKSENGRQWHGQHDYPRDNIRNGHISTEDR